WHSAPASLCILSLRAISVLSLPPSLPHFAPHAPPAFVKHVGAALAVVGHGQEIAGATASAGWERKQVGHAGADCSGWLRSPPTVLHRATTLVEGWCVAVWASPFAPPDVAGADPERYRAFLRHL